ncbi:hypothetical protein Pelo_10407 [Pelomyxa schiedti]|nr:hypothetical protein Pelo_10407 [Pelomyxa schiedti]
MADWTTELTFVGNDGLRCGQVEEERNGCVKYHCVGANCTYKSYATWGGKDNIYSVGSGMCLSALHAGLVDPVAGGTYYRRKAGISSDYPSVNRHGITSEAWAGSYEGFQLLATPDSTPLTTASSSTTATSAAVSTTTSSTVAAAPPKIVDPDEKYRCMLCSHIAVRPVSLSTCIHPTCYECLAKLTETMVKCKTCGKVSPLDLVENEALSTAITSKFVCSYDCTAPANCECKNCGMPFCSNCFRTAHSMGMYKLHEKCFLGDTSKILAPLYSSLAIESEKVAHISAEIGSALEIVGKLPAQLVAVHSEFMQSLEKDSLSLHDSIESRKKLLLKECEKAIQAKETSIQSQRESLQQKLAEVEQLQQVIQTSLDSRSPVLVVSALAAAQSFVAQPPPTGPCVTVSKFSVSDETSAILGQIQMWGKIDNQVILGEGVVSAAGIKWELVLSTKYPPSTSYPGILNTYESLQTRDTSTGAATDYKVDSNIMAVFPRAVLVKSVDIGPFLPGWGACYTNGCRFQVENPGTNQWENLITISGLDQAIVTFALPKPTVGRRFRLFAPTAGTHWIAASCIIFS